VALIAFYVILAGYCVHFLLYVSNATRLGAEFGLGKPWLITARVVTHRFLMYRRLSKQFGRRMGYPMMYGVHQLLTVSLFIPVRVSSCVVMAFALRLSD